VTTSYQRLAAKHDAFVGKIKQERAKLAEAHRMEVAKLCTTGSASFTR
jgi:hypothetical protein